VNVAPRDDRFPGWWQAVGLLAVFLLLQLGLGLAMVGVWPALFLEADDPGVQGVIALVAGGVVAWVGWRRRGGPAGATYPMVRVPAALLIAVVVTVTGMSILLSEADNWLRSVLPPPRWLEEFFEQLVYGRENIVGSLFALVIAAPLAEELLFRGLVLQGFLARYPAGTAIAASAILFGVLHLNPWQAVGAIAYGIVAAWWFVHSGSLVPCILGHALNNGLPAITQLLALDIRGYTTGLTGPVQFQPVWFTALGAALCLAGLWLSRRSLALTGR
jgi:membrane protease YdiL (CAAX protease family)